MICPRCKEKAFIRKHYWQRSEIKCCAKCYKDIRENIVAEIKVEQRRILREDPEGINRLLKKVLPKAELVLTDAGLIKIRRMNKDGEEQSNKSR